MLVRMTRASAVAGESGVLDLSGTSTERLEADICELAAHIDAAVCRWLGLVAEFDRREAWAGWECSSAAMWLSWKCGVSLTTAHEHVRVARALVGLPVIRAAFGRGEISYSKVRALTRVASPAIEGELVEVARESTGAGLERICRAYRRWGRPEADEDATRVYAERALSWCHDDDGAFVFHGRLPAELGELVIQMVHAARAELTTADRLPQSSAEEPGRDRRPSEPPAARRADALVHAARAFLGQLDRAHRRVAAAEVTVIVDADLLADEPASPDSSERDLGARPGRDAGCGAEGTCETADGVGLAPSVARRLACDGVIRGLALGADGEPLRLGRRRRVVTPALRHALDIRDRCCRFPGCDRRGYLDAHHLVHWADAGATDIDNLALICDFHHRRLHEGRWTLTRDTTGTFVARRPDGKRYEPVSVRAGATDRIEAIHERLGLDIDAHTNESLWEGPGGDLSAIIEYLAHLDDECCPRPAVPSAQPGRPAAHTDHSSA
jgi:hypothetical protein